MKGIYIGVSVSTETKQLLQQYMEQHNIPKSEEWYDFHTTLLYSYDYNPDILQDWNLLPMHDIEATFKQFSNFKNNVLVAELESADLISMHRQVLEAYNVTHTYDPYLPHVTLTYDMKDMDYTQLPPIPFPIKYEFSYVQDLKED